MAGLTENEIMTKPVVYQTDSGEVSLTVGMIKQFLAVGSKPISMKEAIVFMQLCKFNGLNPFVRDAYLIKFGEDASMVTSKNAIMKRLVATTGYKGHKAGIIVLVSGEMIKREGTIILTDEELIGGWAEVYMEGKLPIYADAMLSEYIGKTKKGEINKNWRERPATMIRKVALMAAAREAAPGKLGSLYSEDEFPENTGLQQQFTGTAPGAQQTQASDQANDEDGDIVDAEYFSPDTNDQRENEPTKSNTAESPVTPDGTIKKPGRSRRNTIEVFGQKMKSAGITGETYERLKELEKQLGAPAAKLIDQTLAAIGYGEISYLREDEAAGIVRELSQAIQPNAPEVPQPKPEQSQAGQENDSPPPQKQVEPKDKERITLPCPEAEGTRKFIAVCEKRCDKRNNCAVYQEWAASYYGKKQEEALKQVKDERPEEPPLWMPPEEETPSETQKQAEEKPSEQVELPAEFECPLRDNVPVPTSFCVNHCPKFDHKRLECGAKHEEGVI